MKKLYTLLIFMILAISSQAQILQVLSSQPTNLNPNSCSAITFNVNLYQGCINFTYTGTTSYVSNDTIYIEVNYTAGPICAGAISYPTYTTSVNNVPAQTYVVYTAVYQNGVLQQGILGSLVVNNVGCCPAIAQITLNANPICFGDTLVMQSTGGGAISQLWNLNNSPLSTMPTASQIANSAGPYSLQLIVTDGTCSDSISQTVNVQQLPNINLGNDTSICDGSTLVKNVSNSYAIYNWSSGSATNSGSISSIGTLSVTVEDQYGCEGSDSIELLSLIPIANLSLSEDTASFCFGDSAEVTASSSSAGAQFVWSTGDQGASIFLNTNGIKMVTVSAPGFCNRVDAVYGQPTFVTPIQFSLDPNQCAPRAIEVNNDYVSYDWSNGGAMASTSSSVDDTLNITVVDGNGCSASSSIFMAVDPAPIVDLGPDTTICEETSYILTSGASSSSSILWSTNQTNSAIAVLVTGEYWVQVTNSEGCIGTDTMNLTVRKCVGIDEVESSLSFEIYPNPSESMITIKSEKEGRFEIYNQLGKLVLTVNAGKGTNAVRLDNMASGVYFIRNQDQEVVRLIKR